jgi:hypothetical protein
MLGSNKKYPAETNIYHLENVKVVKPTNAGIRWKGVSHYKMVMAMIDYLNEEGIKFKNPRYHLTPDEAVLVFSVNLLLPEAGLIEVQDADDGTGDAMYPCFGFLASNNRRYHLTYYAGASTLDGQDKFVAEKWLGKKYTVKFSPVQQMQAAVDEFIRRYDRAEQVMRKTKKIVLTESRLSKILTESGFRNLMPWTRVGKVLKAMSSTRTTVWKAGLEFGRQVEFNPPVRQMEQLYGYTTVCREFYPEALGTEEEIEKVLMP